MPPKQAAQETRVEAMVRVRPFNRRELELVRTQNDGVCKPIIHMSGRRVALLDPERGFAEADAFDFDEAFWSIPREQMGLGEGADDEITQKVLNQMGIGHTVGQEEVYQKSGAHAVQHAFDGYHSCIFAYGQTGAGKTFTMMGGLDDKGCLDETPAGRENRGVCLRLVEDIFERIQGYKTKGDRTIFKVSLSFIEIYKEKCKDLLVRSAGSPKGRRATAEEQEKEYADLKVRHTPTEGTYVQGAQRIEVKSAQECFALMAHGMSCRHTAATKMNDVSSRSHAIFQLNFKQQDPIRGTDTISNINLVDLAGSERIKMSGAEGARLDEATKINKSLSTLRRVIDVLIENAKAKKGQQKMVPPYRESMLTWLLMESLGGNSKTIMIAAVSPFLGNYEDTYNTLRYANKAKEIVCKVKRNDEQGAVMVAAMRSEMDRLRQQLQQRSDEQDEAARAQLEADLAEAEEQYRRTQAEQEELRKLGDELQEREARLDADLAQREQTAFELRQKRAETQLFQEQCDVLEQSAMRHQQEAMELSLNVKEQEAEIKRTQQEKDRLAKEEAELRRKEEITQAEIKTTKQRQFAISFRNALQLWKDKLFLEELAGRKGEAEARLADMRRKHQEKKAELDWHKEEHKELSERYQDAEERLAALRREHDEEEAVLDEGIQLHSQHKEDAARELEEHKKFITDAEEGIRRAKQRKEDMLRDHEATVGVCQTDCRKLDEDNAQMEATLEELDRKLAQHQSNLEALKLQGAKLSTESAAVNSRFVQVQSRHHDASALNRQLCTEVMEATERLNAAERRRRESQAEIDKLQAKLKRLDRDHRDSKEFLQARFFPTGAKSGPDVLPGGSPGSARPEGSPRVRRASGTGGGSPRRREPPPPPQHTLKSMKHEERNRAATPPRSGASGGGTGTHPTPRVARDLGRPLRTSSGGGYSATHSYPSAGGGTSARGAGSAKAR